MVSATRIRRDITIPLSVGPPTEKFNIVSNNDKRTRKCGFPVSDRKCHFSGKINQNCQFQLKFST